MTNRTSLVSATRSSSLADILERVLDKGVVIAGDIKIKLVEIELLTIQIRLVVCSVERAMAMGMDWWRTDPNWSMLAREQSQLPSPLKVRTDRSWQHRPQSTGWSSAWRQSPREIPRAMRCST